MEKLLEQPVIHMHKKNVDFGTLNTSPKSDMKSQNKYGTNSMLVYINAIKEKEILEKRQKILKEKTRKLELKVKRETSPKGEKEKFVNGNF